MKRLDRVSILCDQCDKEIKRLQSAVKKTNFCSRKCHGKWQSKNRCRENRHNWAQIKINCAWCSKITEKKPSDLRKNNFCDVKCFRKWQSKEWTGENHPDWTQIKINCAWCSKITEKKPSDLRKNNFCNQKCFGKWQSKNRSGENNPNWTGGIASEPYCEVWTDKEYKEDIKARDNYTCQNPDCRGTSKRLVVHHINYDKKDCRPRNLITVCNSCNARANFKRIYWQAFYGLLNYNLQEG